VAIKISTKEELLKIGVDEEYPLDADYELENDIDLEGENIEPIGGFEEERPDPEEDGLQGTFDGNGYKIYNGKLEHPEESGVGLFSYIGKNGKVKNLGVDGVDVEVEGEMPVGGLAGANFGDIQNSYATGDVTGNSRPVGGLAGGNFGDIQNSYATGDVTGNSRYVGGLVGRNRSDAKIYNSYATGDVEGEEEVGGLAGYNSGEIQNTYAIGNVTGEEQLGGLVGYNSGEIQNSYWDTETSGIEEGIGEDEGTTENVEGKTTVEMTVIDTYSNWDIAKLDDLEDEIWKIKDKYDYPRLSWEDYDAPEEPLGFKPINDYDDLKKIGVEEDYPLDGGYYLTQDIDCAGEDPFPGIGMIDDPVNPNPDLMFTGTFDGQGNTIKNLTMNNMDNPDNSFCNFIVNAGAVKDLNFENIDFTGFFHVGAFVNTGNIENCHVLSGQVKGEILEGSDMSPEVGGFASAVVTMGEVTAKVENCTTYAEVISDEYAGGFVYVVNEGAEINNCQAHGNVESGDRGAGFVVFLNESCSINYCQAHGDVQGGDLSAGFVMDVDGIVDNSFSTGNVVADSHRLAGFAVDVRGRGEVNNCYSTGDVESIDEEATTYYVAGFVRFIADGGLVKNCYSTGKPTSPDSNGLYGFVGINHGTVENCFWDMDTSEVDSSDAGEGKTTDEMKQQSTYSEWDIAKKEDHTDEIWYIEQDKDYPRLYWELKEEEEDKEDPYELVVTHTPGERINDHLDMERHIYHRLENVPKELRDEADFILVQKEPEDPQAEPPAEYDVVKQPEDFNFVTVYSPHRFAGYFPGHVILYVSAHRTATRYEVLGHSGMLQMGDDVPAGIATKEEV